MALVKCPECGKEVSDKAQSCPECGYPIQEEVKRLEIKGWYEDRVKEIETNGYDESNLVAFLKDDPNEDRIEQILSLIGKYNPDSYVPKIYRWAMTKEKKNKRAYKLFEKNIKFCLGENERFHEESHVPVYPECGDFFIGEKIKNEKIFNGLIGAYIEIFTKRLVCSPKEIRNVEKDLEEVVNFLKETSCSKSSFLLAFVEYSDISFIHLGDLKFIKEETTSDFVFDQAATTGNYARAIAAQGKIASVPPKPMSTGDGALAGAIIGGTTGAIVGAAVAQTRNQEYKQALQRREALELERAETLAALNKKTLKEIKLQQYFFEIETTGKKMNLLFPVKETENFIYNGKTITARELKELVVNNPEQKLAKEIRNKMKKIYLSTGDYAEARKMEQAEEIKIGRQYMLTGLKTNKEKEEEEKEEKYQRALVLMEQQDEESLREAKQLFTNLGNWKFSNTNKKRCEDELRIIEESKRTNGCYIASCVYGSYDCPQVWTLRRFRDYALDEKWYGKLFIKCYYAVSPTLVKWFGEQKWFKLFWKHYLDKLVCTLNAHGVEDTQYIDKY